MAPLADDLARLIGALHGGSRLGVEKSAVSRVWLVDCQPAGAGPVHRMAALLFRPLLGLYAAHAWPCPRPTCRRPMGLSPIVFPAACCCLTVLYVMVGEVLIFVPSVGRYHRELLENHIQSAELAILPFTEPGGDQLSPALARAAAQAGRCRGGAAQTGRAARAVPGRGRCRRAIDKTIDLTETMMMSVGMADGLDCLLNGGNRMLHVIAPTHIKGARIDRHRAGRGADPRRADGLCLARDHHRVRRLAHHGVLVFAQPLFRHGAADAADHRARWSRSTTIRRIPTRIISASARKDEIGIAERELAAMQRDLYGFLQQKTRLAALGAAVARIQHDLRNILSNAQLASDRLARCDDPVVKRLAPRLVASIDRAVSLATNTLRYGRAEERPPKRKHSALAAGRRGGRGGDRVAHRAGRDRTSTIRWIPIFGSMPIPNSSIAWCSISSAIRSRRWSSAVRRLDRVTASRHGQRVAHRRGRQRPGHSAERARQAVPALRDGGAQRWLGPRPRHRARSGARPWRRHRARRDRRGRDVLRIEIPDSEMT